MSLVMVRWVPQTGQSGSLRSLSSRNFMPKASTSNRRPMSASPAPRISLIASVACITPTSPGSTPSTPPSAHDGTSLGGEDAYLTFKAEDGAIHIRLPRQYAGVVHQVTGCEVVGPVHHQVEFA